MRGERIFSIAFLVLAAVIAGCAAGSGGVGLTIPEGKGMLVLETGGIDRLTYRIIDQATSQEVVNVLGRTGWASSPGAYERSAVGPSLFHFLAPGAYRLVVDTDLEKDEPIVIDDVEVVVGQQRYVRVPIGRFSVSAVRLRETGEGSQESQEQMRFTIYDYGLDHILGTGMTSTRTKYFVAREGIYKIRMYEETGVGAAFSDQIQEVSVRFGQVYPVRFKFKAFGEPSSP